MRGSHSARNLRASACCTQARRTNKYTPILLLDLEGHARLQQRCTEVNRTGRRPRHTRGCKRHTQGALVFEHSTHTPHQVAS